MIFKGSGVALVTPFKKENVYEVDYDKLGSLIDFHLKNDTDALIVCGTTGESATMSDDEKEWVIDYAIKKVNGKLPVIAGTGTNDTRHAISQSVIAEKLGADALLIVTPYYNKCTQEGLYLHYKAIAESVSIPIILYNVPSRTAVNIEPETVARLSQIHNIVAIKEASGNLEQIEKIRQSTSNNFQIFSGNDDQIYDILDRGGDGVISVLANVRPKETHQICSLYFEGKKEQSKSLQTEFQPLIKALFSEVNPIPVKAAINEEIMLVGIPRLPLTPMSEEKKQNLIRELKKI